MEVAIGTNSNTPFQREVREWQRIDPNTGALLTGRLEADRWINGPLNAYGKVVDSQNISQPNGTQQSQRKQLELYQARTSSGSMQVIRAQTVQTTSSRWSSSSSSTPSSNSNPTISNSFENQRNSSVKPICNNINGSSGSSNNQIQKNLTNNNVDNDDHNKNIINNNHHHYQNSQNHKMLTAPSLKLSNLMKSSNNNCNGGGNSLYGSEKNNPHCLNSSMPLIQNHQQQKTEMQRKQDNNNDITKLIPTKSLILQYTNLHDNNNRYEQHLLLQQQQQQQKQLPPTTLDLNRVGGVVDFDYDVKEHKNSMINKFTKEKDTDFYLQRGRSVSTDDLTTEWNENNNNNDDAKNESSEWRRVSKIRRSFQFPKAMPSSPIKSNATRPIDLPENSVSVSKIREELENGRRLNTAMRNNNVDLAALDTILNGHCDDINLSPTSSRKTAFLTSESLKEIRGKLKKLSDESLYKDDFITNGVTTMDNKPAIITNNQQTEKSIDFQTKSNNHVGFENRTRYRDTTSAEWHLRRKSYGFEKMTPPDNKTMYRQETSTDSGIGRSSELGNWSPTESKGTVIAFGEQPKNSTTVVLNGVHENGNVPKIPLVQRRFRPNSEESDTTEMKRHSIAVDETKYVRDNLRKVFDTKTSIHLNGFYSKDNNLVDEIGRQRKRVEFCKTEVHFAAESGRVNIVETDGKPPPTNNFRRRRRSSGNTYLDAITSGLQIMHFGDEKKATILEQESESSDDLTALQNNVTVSVPIVNNDIGTREGNTVTKNIVDEIEQDEISLRGILKNKPIKPKPYHLGENIDTGEKFWGVKLKPVTTGSETDRLFENDTSDICDLEKPDIAKTDFDRVKIVEERKNGTGYSTKINLSLTDAPFEWNSNSESIKPLKLSTTNIIDKNIDFLKKSSHHHLINDNKTNEQCFKSTSLIMQQIRSNLNQNDDDTLINHNQKPIKSSSAIISNTTKLISNITAITKSNSANSIFLEKQRQIYRPKYTSSLDGDIIMNEPTFYTTNILKSNQNSAENLPYNRFMSVVPEEPQKEHEKKPIPAPRINVINSANMLTSQAQYCVGYGGFESDDSAKADEEVKSYLVGSINDEKLNEPKSTSTAAEMFGSWSRIKAQRYVQKSKIVLTEVPQSNIMSIELKSPESVLTKLPSLNCQDTKSSPQIPIAKPRTTVKTSLSPENINSSKQKTVDNNQNNYPQRYQPKTINNEFLPVVKEPLKIVTATNGARKLREHELSYFGVKVNTDDNHIQIQRITNTDIKNPKLKTINNHKNIEIIPNVMTTKWKLSNDKPDLLRHGPVDGITTSPLIINLKDQSPDRNITERIPIYENLQTSSKYNRNKDLDRDEKNLCEMAETADLTMKAVTDRHKLQAQKYHQRLEKHSSTPLDTIDEKRSTRTFYDLESEEKLKPISVLPVVTDSFQRKCCSRRSSSASSTGSISDSGSINNRTKSRSRSREKLDNNNVKKSTLSAAVVVRSRTEHRSSSRDSQKSHNNSMENFKLTSQPQKVERKIKRTITSHSTHYNDKPEPMPRHRREETKTRSSASNRKQSSQHHDEKSSIDKYSSSRKDSNHRVAEKSSSDRKETSSDRKESSSDRRESKKHHGERSSTDRKESSRHLRERSSNEITDSIDRHKHSSRSSTNRIPSTTNDSHKQSPRSSKDSKDSINIRSSQRLSINNRTENAESNHVKQRTDSHERNRSQERHKNNSSTKSSSGKPKVSSTTAMDQKQRTVRSSGGSTTNPTIVNSMIKTSSSSTRHHRSRKDHPRK